MGGGGRRIRVVRNVAVPPLDTTGNRGDGTEGGGNDEKNIA